MSLKLQKSLAIFCANTPTLKCGLNVVVIVKDFKNSMFSIVRITLANLNVEPKTVQGHQEKVLNIAKMCYRFFVCAYDEVCIHWRIFQLWWYCSYFITQFMCQSDAVFFLGSVIAWNVQQFFFLSHTIKRMMAKAFVAFCQYAAGIKEK